METSADRPVPRGASDAALAVRDQIRAAHAAGTTLRILGAESWPGAGRPLSAGTAALPIAPHAGIVDYVPGDLTLTALAGTPLADLERATAAEGQWLPLEPFGAGTLGATLATASPGPLAHAFGPPRDHVLGVEFVTGNGAIVRGGGRVVKNVAGFDLVRLSVGAWGSLGALTEATVRVRARPEADVTVALAASGGGAPGPLLSTIRALQVAPLAVELVSSSLARKLGAGAADAILVRLAGNEPLVAAGRRALAALGDVAELPGDVWTRLRAAEPAGASSLRLSLVPSRLAELWRLAERAVADVPDALLHASVSRGIVRVVVPASAPTSVLRALVALPATCIAERLPPLVWHGVPSAAADPLSRRVKQAFDPAELLNPGIV